LFAGAAQRIHATLRQDFMETPQVGSVCGVGPRGRPLASDPEAASAVYGPRESIVVRRIAGEHLLVPIRGHVSQMKAIFALTGAGGRIWELLDGERALGDVRDALVERFEVGAEQAWAELCEFVEHLEESGLVERRR
jgi:hypothetical protein